MECRVVVYGASLFMAVIEAVLKNQPGFNVIRIDPAQPNAPQCLSAFHPEVVFVDDMRGTLTLAGNRPQIWVSVGASISPMMAVRVQRQHPIHNIDDLTKLVRLSRRE